MSGSEAKTKGAEEGKCEKQASPYYKGADRIVELPNVKDIYGAFEIAASLNDSTSATFNQTTSLSWMKWREIGLYKKAHS